VTIHSVCAELLELSQGFATTLGQEFEPHAMCQDLDVLRAGTTAAIEFVRALRTPHGTLTQIRRRSLGASFASEVAHVNSLN
jgi:hypothetical protein